MWSNLLSPQMSRPTALFITACSRLSWYWGAPASKQLQYSQYVISQSCWLWSLQYLLGEPWRSSWCIWAGKNTDWRADWCTRWTTFHCPGRRRGHALLMKAEFTWHHTEHQRVSVELMLTPASRAPQQICLHWVQFQAIWRRRHPLTNGLHTTPQSVGHIISVLWLSR